MNYAKIQNGSVEAYPYTVDDLKRENPNTSFPKVIGDDLLAEWGVLPVTQAASPSFDIRTEYLTISQTPQEINGEWTVTVSVSSKTADQIAEYDAMVAEDNRNRRDTLLGQTDFYALSDVTMSAEMATYRQALRDITAHANWPHLNDDDWPTKP